MDMLTIENLAFSGGGIKGLAYMGAIHELLKNSDRIDISQVKRTAGTSAGSILAALYAVYNGNYDAMKTLMDEDFSKFEDFTPFGREVEALIGDFRGWDWYKFLLFPWAVGKGIKTIEDASAVYKDLFSKFDATKTGIWAGNAFKQWLEDAIDAALQEAGLGITSKELTFAKIHETDYFRIDPFVIGTNLNSGYPVVFSYQDTPDILLADAVRVSMSIPIFFEPVEMSFPFDGGQAKCLFVDGGVVWNYPIELFDQKQFMPDYRPGPYGNLDANPGTLGLKLDTDAAIAILQDPGKMATDVGQPPPTNGLEFAGYMLNDLMNSQNFAMLLFSRNEQRTVNVSGCGIPATDFKLSKADEQKLFDSGVAGVQNFMARAFGKKGTQAAQPGMKKAN
ncbi:patatin-like phospholipase family protein [Desulfoluna butyratoxydans]|uniref:Acyl transferase/acyl hydrolase/lysophospholipase n=1 Tax=Desulfoluna butyratoxydans TaxID=231438 RepID=A0A4V6IKZ9_9BACT|nr:patatin-like phospholipase family protein [Desulfoluna butyratoxydans]VFQ43138.1 acyl transferase/acyl hydrolase/lysophospholipase [Desulfoluna butyratoxydans]